MSLHCNSVLQITRLPKDPSLWQFLLLAKGGDFRVLGEYLL